MWRRWLAAATAAALVGGVHPQGAQPEILNSERIAQKFGSYAVEVLAAGETVRVSNLYSTDAGARTCRTFAVVRFPATIDPAVATEHAAIVAGGSIGAVFAASGWQVRKSHLHYGEARATPMLARLMRVPLGTLLAEHAYVLDVAKNGRTVEYAALVEVHHPDYLRASELEGIYGRADAGQRSELLAMLLATAEERAASVR